MNEATNQPSRPIAVIADDHCQARELVERVLAPSHEVVAAVGDGEALIEAVQKWDPDLIVVDVDMPRRDGLDAIRALRKQGLRGIMVIITVTADPALAGCALAVGADAFVIKSRLVEDLPRAITAALRHETYVSSLESGTR